MADSKRSRRRGFLTWEPGAGAPRDGMAETGDEREGRSGDGAGRDGLSARDGTGRDGPSSVNGAGHQGSAAGDGTGRDGPSSGHGGARDGLPAPDGTGRDGSSTGNGAGHEGSAAGDGTGRDGSGDGALTSSGRGQGVARRGAAETRPRRNGSSGRGPHESDADYASDDADREAHGAGRNGRNGYRAEPGRTMAEIHHSSAPPDLGPVRRSLDENKAILDAVMGVGTSFDIIFRELRFGRTRLAMYVVNGLFEAIDDLVLLKMTESLTALAKDSEGRPQEELGLEAFRELFETSLAYSQVTKSKSLSDVAFQVMSGPMAILVDGAQEAIIVDIREYPDRQPDEPTTERVIRGPHDGFIETLVFNTALIRRRIRDPRLHFSILRAGVRTQMDVAVAYMDGLTDPSLVHEVTRRIKAIGVDAVTMAERTVAAYLTDEPWNPFPTVRFTERPDVAAIHLMEGHVLVLVDTSPQAIICPSTLWNHLEHPEDYHMSPFMGTYMRWVQFVGLFFATLLPPLWLTIALDPRVVHALPSLAFIGPKKPSGFPLGLQFIGAEVTLDLLRRAILNTPSTLSATMGILGAIVLGDVAAKTGIFSSEVLVYIVLAAIGQFAVSNLELGESARIVRLTMLIAVWALRLPGLLIGSLIWLLVLLSTRTFGIPYTWPLIPFNWPALRNILIRAPVQRSGPRPLILRAQDRTRH